MWKTSYYRRAAHLWMKVSVMIQSMRTVPCTEAGSPEADAVRFSSSARVTSRNSEHFQLTCVEQEDGREGVSLGVTVGEQFERSFGPVRSPLTISLTLAMIVVDNASSRGSLGAQSSIQSITEDAGV